MTGLSRNELCRLSALVSDLELRYRALETRNKAHNETLATLGSALSKITLHVEILSDLVLSNARQISALEELRDAFPFEELWTEHLNQICEESERLQTTVNSLAQDLESLHNLLPRISPLQLPSPHTFSIPPYISTVNGSALTVAPTSKPTMTLVFTKGPDGTKGFPRRSSRQRIQTVSIKPHKITYPCTSHPFSSNILLFVLCLLLLIPSVLATNIPAASSLSVYSLNANGMGHTVKMSHLRMAIKTVKPSAFVLNESKTKDSVKRNLPLDEYEVFEERAVRCEGNSHLYKWGTVLGIRKDVQIIQRLIISDNNLRGRVVAVDVALQTNDRSTFVHRIFAVYAPWNPGTNETKDFWPALTKLVKQTPTSWTLAGDLNATTISTERASGGVDGRNSLLKFLSETGGVDLWSLKPERSRLDDWTCKSRAENSAGGSIIDRVISSQQALADSDISVVTASNTFVPCTDHRAVLGRCVLKIGNSPSIFVPHPVVFNPPRLKYPTRKEAYRHDNFKTDCERLCRNTGLFDIQVTDDRSFLDLYTRFGEVMNAAAETAYGRVKRYKPLDSVVTNSDIQRQLGYARSLGGALRMARGDTFSPSHASITSHEKLSRRHKRLKVDAPLTEFILEEKRRAYRDLYQLRAKEIADRALRQENFRISEALKGGSTRKLLSAKEFVPLPLIVKCPNSDDLVSDPEQVKEVSREYWSSLYHHDAPAPLPKPWLTTPSVLQIKVRVQQNPFHWPRTLQVDDYRALLQKGNARPAPGPDGWEKWVVKRLGDETLALVLRLHNYIVINAQFPGKIKDMWLTMFHKRGLRTDLSNWRGLLLSNFIANSPMTLLNSDLVSYVSRTRILPDTQVATQKDVQTRDLMSFLASIKCWSTRHKQPVYAIKRDQMKGFDYLSPEGMYDAVRAYGLPQSVIDLDRAAQTDTRCFIRTAHGITEPIIISGVTKQGGPLSPLKSTLTTSLGHHYLNDMLRLDPHALIIRSASSKAGDPHLPADSKSVLVGMAEATDDSYIFSTSLASLRTNVLAMEQFQYAYGWLTQWSKTYAYAINVSGSLPEMVSFDTITKGDPTKVTVRDVPLIRDQLEFLGAAVDDPSARYHELRDFIDSFTFPQFQRITPITLLRKIVSQNIISRCRALLSLQPIKQDEAEDLDKRIARKIHDELRFPFQMNSRILHLPVSLRGLGFPSIARINAAIAIEGIARDLNHHIPAYQTVAQITLSDWTCSLNHCIDPLQKVERTSKSKLWKKVPATWVIAHKTLASLDGCLSLRQTDKNYILNGDVSLSHFMSVFNQYTPGTGPTLDGNTTRSLRAKNITKLSHLGKWTWSLSTARYVFQPRSITVMRGWSLAAKENLRKMLDMLSHFQLSWLHDGDWSILYTRDHRRQMAENQVRQIAHIHRLSPIVEPSGNSGVKLWASDGSMVPAAAGILDRKSVTAAVAGQLSLALRVDGISANILHGEMVGLVASTILSADDHSTAHATIYSDHLNAVRIISDTRILPDVNLMRLRRLNGRSYYRWLIHLLRNRPRTDIAYVKAHTTDTSSPSLLNHAADHYASSAQKVNTSILAAPIPTFCMDDYTFYYSPHGWYEGSIRTLTEKLLEERSAFEICKGLNLRMIRNIYDPRPPPEYPYCRAISAYSAVVQLYARSGQLPVAETLFERRKIISPTCRSGCVNSEDPHHVFVTCNHYRKWREAAASVVHERTKRRLDQSNIPLDMQTLCLSAAKSLFIDCNKTWPLKYSTYYLGFLPRLDELLPHTPTQPTLARERMLHNLAADWHTHSIRLAGRIFGDYQRRMALKFAPVRDRSTQRK